MPEPTYQELYEVARLANAVVHYLSQYFGGMFVAGQLKAVASEDTRRLRDALNRAGFIVTDEGDLIAPAVDDAPRNWQ